MSPGKHYLYKDQVVLVLRHQEYFHVPWDRLSRGGCSFYPFLVPMNRIPVRTLDGTSDDGNDLAVPLGELTGPLSEMEVIAWASK